MEIEKKSLYVILLIVEIILWFVGVLLVLDTCSFLFTQKEVSAVVNKIEKVEQPKPYIITLTYYNEYKKVYVTKKMNDIDSRFGKKIDTLSNNKINILYGKFFPTDIYISNYKHPNFGEIVILLVFIFIISLGVYYQLR